MKEIRGTNNKILEVNLSKKSVDIHGRIPRAPAFSGAKGLGLKLLFDRLTPGCDPLGPENIIAFMPANPAPSSK